jgi:hypothetical protein
MTTTNPAPTTTTAPATDPTTTTTAPATDPNTGAPPAFYTSFKDEATKGYAHVKQFQDPESAVHAYMNLEKLIGDQDKLLKISDDAAEMEKVWGKLGKPAKPEEYNLPIPEKATEQDKAFYEFAKKAFHGANLTTGQAEAVIKQINEFSLAKYNEAQAAHEANMKAQNEVLTKEWGASLNQNTNIAGAAAKSFGVTHEQIDKIQSVLGYAETMKLFHKFGAKMGEARFVGGDNVTNETNTPDMAKAQLESLKQDKAFMAKYVAGDHSAKAKMQKLFAEAYPN